MHTYIRPISLCIEIFHRKVVYDAGLSHRQDTESIDRWYNLNKASCVSGFWTREAFIVTHDTSYLYEITWTVFARTKYQT